MGSIVVYRYRPMRLVPTTTTSAVIATGSLCLVRTLLVGLRGVNRQLGEKCNHSRGKCDIFLREPRGAAKYPRM